MNRIDLCTTKTGNALMLSKYRHIVIAGGGLHGLTTAWCLQRNGYSEVTVLEAQEGLQEQVREATPALMQQYHPKPRIRRDLVRNRSLLNQFESSWEVRVHEEGASLWRFSPESYQQLDQRTDRWLHWERVPAREVPSTFNGGSPSDSVWISFERDGHIRRKQLMDQLHTAVSHSPVRIRTGIELLKGVRAGDQWRLTLDSGEELTADRVVNTAGARANDIGERLGVSRKDVQPVCRHQFTVSDTLVPQPYNFVMDASRRFCLDRTQDGTVIRYQQRNRGSTGTNRDVHSPEECMNREMQRYYPNLELNGLTYHGCSKTMMTTDRTPVVQPDPEEPTLIWATAMNDYNCSYAFRMGERAARLVQSYGSC